jgi:Restriction endonuclease
MAVDGVDYGAESWSTAAAGLTQPKSRNYGEIRVVRRLRLVSAVVLTSLLIGLGVPLVLVFIVAGVDTAVHHHLASAIISFAIAVGLTIVIAGLARPLLSAVAMYRARRRGETELSGSQRPPGELRHNQAEPEWQHPFDDPGFYRRIRLIRLQWLARAVVLTFLLVGLCAVLLFLTVAAVVAGAEHKFAVTGVVLGMVVGLALVIFKLVRPWWTAVENYRSRRGVDPMLRAWNADRIRNEGILEHARLNQKEFQRQVEELTERRRAQEAERIRTEKADRIQFRERMQAPNRERNERIEEQRRRRDQEVVETARIDGMTGRQFEQYVAARLRLAGWAVSMTAATGDFGVDVIAARNGERVAIQCKRLGHTVGVGAVQQVVSGAMHHRCSRSMVVSNREFTRAAQLLAKTHNCELVGRTQLRTWTLT